MENETLDLGPHKNKTRVLAQGLIQDAGIISVPVSLKTIIEYLQRSRNLTVSASSDFSNALSGFLYRSTEVDNDFTVIGYNEKHPWCRRRFTIAHEIGHLLMGHACNKQEDDGTHNETEANLFAGELLMPTKFLKKDTTKTKDIPTLARIYLVSSHAMGIKLMDARLLK